jgi:hypothetical protein
MTGHQRGLHSRRFDTVTKQLTAAGS